MAVEYVQKAIDQANKGWYSWTEHVGKKGLNLEVEIKKGAGAFVCGRKTALVLQ